MSNARVCLFVCLCAGLYICCIVAADIHLPQTNGRRTNAERMINITIESIRALAQRIQQCYKAYNVGIRLRPHSCGKDWVIFDVGILACTDVNRLAPQTKNVQAVLKIPYFVLTQIDQSIYLLASGTNSITVDLTEMLNPKYSDAASKQYKLPVAMGMTIFHELDYEDISQMQHTAYTGSTGSGKSIGLQCLIMSLATFRSPEELNLLIIDVGGRSLWCFDGLPHLSYPVIKDRKSCVYVLKQLVDEMERRLTLSPEELNSSPAIVCVFDEFVSFVDNEDKSEAHACKRLINNILRRARKVNIYLVLATQSPKQEHLDGLDLNNITTRVAFRNASRTNSTSALGCAGAENLRGKGDMIVDTAVYSDPLRLQGAYIDESTIKKLVAQAANQQYDTANKFVVTEAELDEIDMKAILDKMPQKADKDPVLATNIMWALTCTEVSVSKIQKELHLSRSEAEDFINTLQEMGFVSEKYSNQPRKVIPQAMSDLTEEQIDFLAQKGCTKETLSQLYEARNDTTQ